MSLRAAKAAPTPATRSSSRGKWSVAAATPLTPQFKFHLIPRCSSTPLPHTTAPHSQSGILNPNAVCILGNGMAIHLPTFFAEIDELRRHGVNFDGRLLISDRAHILFDFHQIVDGLAEAELEGANIGTTRRGIGPCYRSRGGGGSDRQLQVEPQGAALCRPPPRGRLWRAAGAQHPQQNGP
jgi:hypothetical protein